MGFLLHQFIIWSPLDISESSMPIFASEICFSGRFFSPAALVDDDGGVGKPMFKYFDAHGVFADISVS